MDEGVYARGVQAAQKAGIDYRDPTQVDNLLGAHRTLAPGKTAPLESLKQEARKYKSAEEEINAIQKRANSSRNGKLTITEENRIAELQTQSATPQEVYSMANSDISRTRSPGTNEDGFTVEDWGGKKRYVSLNDASPKTKMKVRKAEAEYEKAKANSTGTVAPGTRGPVQIAREKLNQAYSDAIKDLGLQDYATTNSGKRTFNSRYNDWLETKYKDRNIDTATIKDMAANPQKYRQQFETETSTDLYNQATKNKLGLTKLNEYGQSVRTCLKILREEAIRP